MVFSWGSALVWVIDSSGVGIEKAVAVSSSPAVILGPGVLVDSRCLDEETHLDV
jgi:hypothetical protein